MTSNYPLQHTSVAEQRHRQASWRKWDEMLNTVVAPYLVSKDDTPSVHVLDLGCGTGDVVNLMNSRGWKTIGVDGDPNMIAAAKNKYPTANVVCRDVGTLTMTQQVDLIWSSFTVQYFVSKLDQVLPMWMNLLKPGGLVVIVETNGLFSCHEPNESRSAFVQMEEALRDKYGYDPFAGQKVEPALRKSGFEIVHSSEWNDAEFAFDGPARPEIFEAWDQRCDRMKLPKLFFGEEAWANHKAAFLSCLQSPEHRTLTKLRLVVGRKRPS